MPEEDKKQFNIYLPAKLIREVKLAAINSDQSLSAFVEEALKNHLLIAGKIRDLDLSGLDLSASIDEAVRNLFVKPGKSRKEKP